MSTIALLAFIVTAVIDWFAVSESNSRLEHVVKPAALGALLVWAGFSYPPGWLIAALALSLLGDIYLMLPEDRFVAGLSAFLLAHIAYIECFHASFGARLLWLVVIVLASAPLSRRILMSLNDPALRFAVGAYMAVISFMLASAFASGLWLAAIGALLFVASDSMIAWSRFVQDFSSSRLAVIVTYHLGQWALVAALR